MHCYVSTAVTVTRTRRIVTLGEVHTKLIQTKQNSNKSETNVHTHTNAHTHTHTQKRTRFLDVQWTPELNTSSGASRKMKMIRTWLRPALYSSHPKYKKKTQEAFWMRPPLSIRKILNYSSVSYSTVELLHHVLSTPQKVRPALRSVCR